MKGAAPPCRPGDPVLCGDTLQPEGSVGGGSAQDGSAPNLPCRSLGFIPSVPVDRMVPPRPHVKD